MNSLTYALIVCIQRVMNEQTGEWFHTQHMHECVSGTEMPLMRMFPPAPHEFIPSFLSFFCQSVIKMQREQSKRNALLQKASCQV